MKKLIAEITKSIENFSILLRNRFRLFISFLILTILSSIFEGFSLAGVYGAVRILIDADGRAHLQGLLSRNIGFEVGATLFNCLFLTAILAVFVLRTIFLIISLHRQNEIRTIAEVHWQSEIFSRYLQKDYEFFVEARAGDLIQKQMVHTRECSDSLLLFCGLLRDAFSLSAIIFCLAFVSVKVTMGLIISALSFFALFMWVSRTKIYRGSKEHASYQSYIYALANEAIHGIREIKLFLAESYFLNNFLNSSLKKARIYIRNATLSRLPQPVMQLAAVGMIVGVMFFVLQTGLATQVALPLMVVFGAGFHKLITYGSSFNSQAMSIVSRLPSIQIVSDLLREGSRKTTAPGMRASKSSFDSAIVLDRVSFSYKTSESFKLNDVCLEFTKGRFYGIVGHSGCGKSTLLDLIAGLYRPSYGKIYIDGMDLSFVSVDSWLKLIGYVSQNIFMFSGSVEENVAFGKGPDGMDEEKVREALQIAGLDEVCQRLPSGRKTQVGEKGYKLSGGERQRLAIARAIYHGPEIFIFDEATSALDSQSEKRIQDAIKLLSKQKKTLIVSAHRLGTVIDSDEIIVMDRGQVVGKGTHASLTTNNQIYMGLYNAQYAADKGRWNTFAT
ncbi:MAG: ABC transporter ATP-binding protein [Planctomycetes bacterium]|nr:ABC transporter ATP-binding protein [Planctomycetota bacterium]